MGYNTGELVCEYSLKCPDCWKPTTVRCTRTEAVNWRQGDHVSLKCCCRVDANEVYKRIKGELQTQ